MQLLWFVMCLLHLCCSFVQRPAIKTGNLNCSLDCFNADTFFFPRAVKLMLLLYLNTDVRMGDFEHMFCSVWRAAFCFISGIFTVMCYNVLCDKYATRQMYGYCPSWALEWEYRKKGILDEIRHYAADIISLQVRMFMNYFKSVFFFYLALQPFTSLSLLNFEVSRSHTMTQHSR
jgi:hypothetical protein